MGINLNNQQLFECFNFSCNDENLFFKIKQYVSDRVIAPEQNMQLKLELEKSIQNQNTFKIDQFANWIYNNHYSLFSQYEDLQNDIKLPTIIGKNKIQSKSRKKINEQQQKFKQIEKVYFQEYLKGQDYNNQQSQNKILKSRSPNKQKKQKGRSLSISVQHQLIKKSDQTEPNEAEIINENQEDEQNQTIYAKIYYQKQRMDIQDKENSFIMSTLDSELSQNKLIKNKNFFNQQKIFENYHNKSFDNQYSTACINNEYNYSNSNSNYLLENNQTDEIIVCNYDIKKNQNNNDSQQILFYQNKIAKALKKERGKILEEVNNIWSNEPTKVSQSSNTINIEQFLYKKQFPKNNQNTMKKKKSIFNLPQKLYIPYNCQ